jgi:hypothetical protein
MTVFIDEPGPDGEPTLWVLENGDTDNYHYAYILSRVDLTPDTRRYWDEIVARMTGTTITNDEATLEIIRDVLDRHQYQQVADAAAQVMKPWRPFDEMPERTRRIRHNQFIDAARAVLAALTGGAT